MSIPEPVGLTGSVRALASGEVTSRTLIERGLAAIAATQPTLNAFRRVRAEAALAEAEEADRRLAAGERLPLLGVPVAVKDDTDVAGGTTPRRRPGGPPRRGPPSPGPPPGGGRGGGGGGGTHTPHAA